MSGAKVHKGFLDSYNEVQKELVATVLDQFKQYPSYKVAVTGHSLGGAQALLCALDLHQREAKFTSSNLLLYTQGMSLFCSVCNDPFPSGKLIQYFKFQDNHV